MTRIRIANPTDRTWTKSSFVLYFASGTVHIMAYANHLQDALDAAVDYIEDEDNHLTGLLVSHEEIAELMLEAERDEGLTGDAAHEWATADMTCAGNHGRYLPSWEWGIALEAPTKAELIAAYRR